MLADSGYQQVSELRIGQLPRRNRADIALNLQAGGHYFIVGACDDDCSDVFLAKYDSGGNEQWIKQMGSSGDDWAFAVAVEGDGWTV